MDVPCMLISQRAILIDASFVAKQQAMAFGCIHLSKLPLVVFTYQKLPLYNKQLH